MALFPTNAHDVLRSLAVTERASTAACTPLRRIVSDFSDGAESEKPFKYPTGMVTTLHPVAFSSETKPALLSPWLYLQPRQQFLFCRCTYEQCRYVDKVLSRTWAILFLMKEGAFTCEEPSLLHHRTAAAIPVARLLRR